MTRSVSDILGAYLLAKTAGLFADTAGVESSTLPIGGTNSGSYSCCGGSSATATAGGSVVHARLKELLQRYDVNDYAASVKVYAVKPR